MEIVELGKGRPLKALAGDLEARRILSSARLFTLYARLKGGDARLKAGYYQFDDGMRPSQILAKMISGEVYQRVFALPEGYSSYQVAEMLEKRGIFPKENFLAACRDAALLKELGIDAASVEGYLFPGSYNILPGKTELEVVREMVQRQQAFLKESVDGRARAKGVPVQQLLILASMVEKEAVLPAEKPLIAAVFQNRLRLGMRLQSDPTALYGVRAFAGKVRREDILKPTPYNTYLIPALPPGPIGNPGKDAIEAVLNPAAVSYLYFVGRGDGSHQFSNDLSSHNQAVQKYLKAPAAAVQGGS
ncbi:endolytic transglycosylase MltG [Geomonas paludis]|uniref:Endolytic murein transglycosylase n=1 Tax=Geomonas paludis TaxID=2740185 RepID=A0A6V8MSF9_9BACT|nr:endolytic transglycosylase MltG [Geomonas paludis]UPU35367.1 endolytic transglycosylase MltG [Geomonas paludis]GFO63068.1 aminodeoxychorismate lyase [Geomonas paludis]